MAKPELEDGWLQLAYELDAALDLGDFTKAERIVLNAVKAQLYGRTKHRWAVVVVADIVGRGEWKRQFVERGVKSLRDANVLVAVGRGEYRLNKYYRTWKFADGSATGNGSRFADGELNYINDSPSVARSHQQTLSNRRVAKDATNELHRATDELHPTQPTSCISATNELHPHIEERARQKNLEINTEKTPLPPDVERVVVVEKISVPAEEKAPAELKTAADLAAWLPRAVKPGQDLEDLEELLPALVDFYPAAWIGDAVLTALASAAKGSRAAYANACLANWKKSGGPPRKAARVAEPKHAPGMPASYSAKPAPPTAEQRAREQAHREQLLSYRAKQAEAIRAKNAEREATRVRNRALIEEATRRYAREAGA